jgi:hypothetical protein
MDFAQRTIDLARQNVIEGHEAVEVYRFWRERNGGERRVGGA